MRFGTGVKHRASGGTFLAAVAVAVAMSVALVTPANGPIDASAHELRLVHPIFSHEHDPHVAPDADDPSVHQVAEDAAPVFAPVGPFGSGLGLAFESMLAATLLALPGLVFAAPAAVRRIHLAQQAWVIVPTAPPR